MTSRSLSFLLVVLAAAAPLSAEEGLQRHAPHVTSEAFLFQGQHYWHLSFLDNAVMDFGTVGSLQPTYDGIAPGQPFRAALPGDFDQDGEGDLLLLQDPAYTVVQLSASRELAAGSTAELGLDPDAEIDGAVVLGSRTIVAAQGTRLIATRFDAGVPSVVGERAWDSPVDALAAWRYLLFVFSGDTMTRWDLRTDEMESYALADLGVEGPVETASVGPSMRVGHPRIWGSTGNTLWSVPLRECGETLTITLAELKDLLDLQGMSPEIGLDGVAAYSLQRVLWPWAYHHVEMQWGYRDAWAGDPAPGSSAATPWDGEMRPTAGPVLDVPLLVGRHALADRAEAPVTGVLFSWTHANMVEPSSIYAGGRARGAGDGLAGRENRTGRYHFYAGGVSWRSTTTDEWDGVDCGFFYSMADAASTRVTLSFPLQGVTRDLSVEELTSYHEVIRPDAAGHTIEIGPVHGLATDVSEVFMEFGHFRHGDDAERPPCPPAGFLAAWDGSLQVVQGEGYAHVAETGALESGGSYFQGTDDRFLSEIGRTRLLSWQASTLDPGEGGEEIDRISVEVAVPNPRIYPEAPRTVLRGQAGTVVVDFPALDPPSGWCSEVFADTGYDHEVHSMIQWHCECR